MPPLAISKGDLRRLVEITAESIAAALRDAYRAATAEPEPIARRCAEAA